MRLTTSTTDLSGSEQTRSSSLYPVDAADTLEAQMARVERLRRFCLMLLGYGESEIPTNAEEQKQLYSAGGNGSRQRQLDSRRMAMRYASTLLGIPISTYRVFCDFEIVKSGRSTLRMRDALEMPMRLLLLLAPADFPDEIRHYSRLPEWMNRWSAYQLHYWLVTGERPPAGLEGRAGDDSLGSRVAASVSDEATWKAMFAHLLRVMPISEELAEDTLEAIRRRQLDPLNQGQIDWGCVDKLLTQALMGLGDDIKGLDDLWWSYWRVRDIPEFKIPNYFSLAQDHRLSPALLGDPRGVPIAARILGCQQEQLFACLLPAVPV